METENKTGWHWPHFKEILCARMREQDLLGLPDFFTRGRFSDILPQIFRELRYCSTTTLCEMAESSHASLAERLVAGNMLALLQDTRISSLAPEMRHIKGGLVEIGLNANLVSSVMAQYRDLGLDEKWIVKECPRHSVQLQDYKIAKYPVTNQEYKTFLLETHYPELPSSWTFRQYPIERANHPVYTVSSAAADVYAKWLAEKTGRKFRLPTEAEWEYAAAGPQGLEFPWGDCFEPDYANTAETGLFHSTPVGIFVEGNSPFGLADMAGNVEEYVSDTYKAYPGGQFIEDHLVEVNPVYHVARGGCFARFRDLARTRRRHGHNPRSPAYVMGFRLAETVQP